MIVSIHQPNFMPYLGFFDKILKSDIFVIYDDAQYSKENFINRNRINNCGNELLLTIPVKKNSWHLAIKDVETDKTAKDFTFKKHLKTIESVYGKCPYYEKYKSLIHNQYKIYLESNNLIDINIYTIESILKLFGWNGTMIFSSTLNIKSKDATEKLIEIIKKVGGTHYLCGNSGFNYMNLQLFQDAKISIIPQNFIHAEYNSKHPFIKNMCIYDYLLNNDNNIEIFKKNY